MAAKELKSEQNMQMVQKAGGLAAVAVGVALFYMMSMGGGPEQLDAKGVWAAQASGDPWMILCDKAPCRFLKV